MPGFIDPEPPLPFNVINGAEIGACPGEKARAGFMSAAVCFDITVVIEGAKIAPGR
jgi:hypothetical protein